MGKGETRMTIAHKAVWLPFLGYCELIDWGNVVNPVDIVVHHGTGELAPPRCDIRPREGSVRSRIGADCLATIP